MSLLPSPVAENVPVVGSFAVAAQAQVRMTVSGARARVSVALPEDVTVTATTMISALLSPETQVLEASAHHDPDRTYQLAGRHSATPVQVSCRKWRIYGESVT